MNEYQKVKTQIQRAWPDHSSEHCWCALSQADLRCEGKFQIIPWSLMWAMSAGDTVMKSQCTINLGPTLSSGVDQGCSKVYGHSYKYFRGQGTKHGTTIFI